MASSTEKTSWTDRLPAPLRQDPKKAVVLGVLLTGLLGWWGLKIFSNGAGPKRAGAMPIKSTAASPFVTDSTGRRIRPAESGDELQRWLDAEIPLVVSRNLFAVDFDYFPVDGSRPSQSTRTSGQETFWDQLAKSLSTQADQQEKRANLIQNLRQQAGQLQIASTFMGARPKALINGVLVGEGEVVAGFRVLKIEARRVIFEREGIRLEVPMK
jgi:hypothetical protein